MDRSNGHFRTILIPLDGSALAEQAVKHALAIAGRYSRITLLHVLRPSEPAQEFVGGSAANARPNRERAPESWLASVEKQIGAVRPDIRVSVRIEVGDPAELIVRVANSCMADLIAMLSKGSGFDDVQGDNDVLARVQRSTHTTMLIVHPTAERAGVAAEGVRRLVVPLDGSETARQALHLAQDLARELHLPIHLMTVIDPLRDAALPFTYRPETLPMIDQSSARRLLQTRQMLEQTGACLLLKGFSVSWEILEGSTVSSLVDGTCPGDTVVMTNHGRGGNTIWPLGSTADALCRRCPVPIVLVQTGGGARREESMVTALTAPPPFAESSWQGTVSTW